MKTLELDIRKSGITPTDEMKKAAEAANALLHSGKGAGSDFLGWVDVASWITDANLAGIEKTAA